MNAIQPQPSELLKNKPPLSALSALHEWAANGYCTPMPGQRVTFRARHGTPAGTWTAIRKELPQSVSKLVTVQREHETNWRRTYAELNRLAEKRTSVQHQDHIDELSRKILDGRGAELPDAFDLKEFEADKATTMTAFKNALHKISLDAHKAALPLLETAIVTGKKLLNSEIESEIARHERWGVPLDVRPSEILLSLKNAIEVLQDRLAPPMRGTPPSYLLLNLFEL